MKKNYETPKVLVQEFEANEYCQVCWYVGCDWEKANILEATKAPTNPNWPFDKENNFEDGQQHDAAHCGTPGNQVIYTNASGTPTGMYEINSTTGVKNLQCYLFDGKDYNTSANYANVKVEDTIYWTTRLDNGTTWYHQGKVYGVNDDHPNRS